jgi:uncharacterized damage-inducible protein DinB
MAIRDALLPEFDNEMVNTRKMLERVPEDRFAWKPHAKSWALGGLATHVANIPTWAAHAMTNETFDIMPGGTPLPQTPPAASRSDLLSTFDKNVAAAHDVIAGAEDAALMKNWSLLRHGQTILSMPRAAVLRSFVMNHLIHHRAQLGVYLRLNDVPVPGMYGPSADEGM